MRANISNFAQAAAMAQHVPQWLRENTKQYYEACTKLHTILSYEKARAIIEGIEAEAERSSLSLIELLEQAYQLALRGGYDNDYTVWRYAEDDFGVDEI